MRKLIITVFIFSILSVCTPILKAETGDNTGCKMSAQGADCATMDIKTCDCCSGKKNKKKKKETNQAGDKKKLAKLKMIKCRR